MSILRRADTGRVRLPKAVGLVALALACASPCRASVFAISELGEWSPVASVDASPPASLTAAADVPPPQGSASALTPLAWVAVPTPFAAATVNAAIANGLAPDLLAAVVWQESHWRAGVVSRVGAVGLAQLLPSTASGLHVNPLDPTANLYGAARYLREQLDRFGGNVELALAAYNAGPERVLRAHGVPAIAETQSYVAAVMDRLSAVPKKRY